MAALCRSIFEKSRTTVALEHSSRDCTLFARVWRGHRAQDLRGGSSGSRVPFRRWLHSIREVLALETRRAAKNARLVCGHFRKRSPSQKRRDVTCAFADHIPSIALELAWEALPTRSIRANLPRETAWCRQIGADSARRPNPTPPRQPPPTPSRRRSSTPSRRQRAGRSRAGARGRRRR